LKRIHFLIYQIPLVGNNNQRLSRVHSKTNNSGILLR